MKESTQTGVIKMLLKLIPKKIKVWLLKRLYKDIAAEGRGGDTQIAHINDYEAGLLKSIGGSGTINPATGLIEFVGGGGGGGPAKTESTGTTYSSNIPEYAKPYYEELLKQTGKQVYSTDGAGYVTGVQPFQRYQGQRLAGFTPQQKRLQGQVAALDPNARGYDDAFGITTRASNQADAAMNYGLRDALAYAPRTTSRSDIFAGYTRPSTVTDDTVTTESFIDPGVAASYMDPYQTNVTDMLKEDARRDAAIAKTGRGLGSIGRGTFGGGRQALTEGQADRDLQTTLAKIGYQGEQDAFRNAQEQFERDQGRSLQASTANQSADIQAEQLNQATDMQAAQLRQQSDTTNQATDLQAQGMQQSAEEFAGDLSKQLGLSGLQAKLEAGKSMASIAGEKRMTELKTLLAQTTDADEIQKLNQEMLSLKYQEFKEQQDYGKKQVQFMSDVLRGNTGALGSTDVQYAAAPSLASQIGGGVAGIAGLYGALSGGG